jgi:ferredoxin
MSTMATATDKVRTNVAGAFYVDISCIDCDMCRSSVPEVFRRDDDFGFSYVYRQPQAAEEIARAQAALDDCPANSIGSDG